MDKLLPQVETYVSSFMSNYDASHDYQHVQRVLGLAQKIAAEEQRQNTHVEYDSDLIILSALLHNVGDRKYLKPGQDGQSMARAAFLNFGAEEAMASKVQTIINHVSYTSEVKDPAKGRQILEEFPELGVVQDADRLDAIGAVGIARCFAYGGAATNRSLEHSLDHFGEKLEKLEGMMKTATGKRMARVRTERLRIFQTWWADEVSNATPAN